MKRLAMVAAFVALAACEPASVTRDMQQGDRIRAAEQAQLAAVQAEDIEAVVAAYAPDAVLYEPGGAPRTDAAGIHASFESLFADPNGHLVFTPQDVILPSSSDYGTSVGTFSVTFTDPETQAPATISGNYMTLWRRQDDDSWKIIRDMSAPAGPPSAEQSAPAEPAPN